MLVLSRKLNESIQIGADVRITVVRLDGGQVRLGIEAPGDVVVTRTELLDRPPQPTAPPPAPLPAPLRGRRRPAETA